MKSVWNDTCLVYGCDRPRKNPEAPFCPKCWHLTPAKLRQACVRACSLYPRDLSRQWRPFRAVLAWHRKRAMREIRRKKSRATEQRGLGPRRILDASCFGDGLLCDQFGHDVFDRVHLRRLHRVRRQRRCGRGDPPPPESQTIGA